MMDQDANKFRPVFDPSDVHDSAELCRVLGVDNMDSVAGLRLADGSPAPVHWAKFKKGEEIILKGHVYRVTDIQEKSITFEPVRPVEYKTTGKGPYRKKRIKRNIKKKVTKTKRRKR